MSQCSGRLAVAALVLWLSPPPTLAQQPAAPVPLFPEGQPRSIEPEPLPPLAPAPPSTTAPARPPMPALDYPASPRPAVEATTNAVAPTARVFCDQSVTVRVGEPDTVPVRYRPFLGIWSDAAWSPQLCAALIVENVAPDGTATIVYAFGPIGSNARPPGGVLNGTGVIRDGELRFQNSDGSQFVFRPLYADLDGRLSTPKGQTYRAMFKKTP